MASKTAHLFGASVMLALGLSAQAQDNQQTQASTDNAAQISAEIIVVAQKAEDEEMFHLAMQPDIANSHDLILQSLQERLSRAEKIQVKGPLDI
ncbi:MAG: hypothetical protein ACFHXK_18365 [bacterium]